jgi:transposase-like protein
VRNSLNYVSCKRRKVVAADLKIISNAIKSVNMSLRKITKNRGSFPSDGALLKLFYLALINISKKWSMLLRNWKAALTGFTIPFEDAQGLMLALVT